MLFSWQLLQPPRRTRDLLKPTGVILQLFCFLGVGIVVTGKIRVVDAIVIHRGDGIVIPGVPWVNNPAFAAAIVIVVVAFVVIAAHVALLLRSCRKQLTFRPGRRSRRKPRWVQRQSTCLKLLGFEYCGRIAGLVLLLLELLRVFRSHHRLFIQLLARSVVNINRNHTVRLGGARECASSRRRVLFDSVVPVRGLVVRGRLGERIGAVVVLGRKVGGSKMRGVEASGRVRG
ncbi:hypothetical protein BDZ88DRAFT_427008 [Geranomyces variabilis]|nr:hypothetical protein BDZ88DRAFT_427008 [Geranomyces variabilis]